MQTVYLHYEVAASFGVIATPSVPSVPLPAEKYPVPLIVSAGVDAVLIWSVRKGDVVARFSNSDIRKATTITALAVSPDGSTIAAGYADGSIRTWTVTIDSGAHVLPEKQPLATFNGHRAHVTSLSFESVSNASDQIPDSNKLVSASADGDVIMWDLAGESGVFRLPAHNDVVTSVILMKYHGRDIILSSSKDGLVRVYDVGTQHCVQTVVGHRAEVWAMVLDPSHTLLLTGSVDAEVRVFRFIDPNASPEDGENVDQSDSSDVLTPLGSVQRQNAAARVGAIHCERTHGEAFALVTGNDRTAELFRIRTARDADKHRVRRKKRFTEKQEKQKRAESEAFPNGVEAEEEEEEEASFVDIVEAKDFLISVRALRMPSKFRGVRILADKYQLSTKKSTLLEVRFLMQTADNTLEIYKVIASKKKTKKRKRVSEEVDDEENEGGEEIGLVEKLSSLDRTGHRGDVRSIAMSPDDRMLLSASKKSLKLWNVAEGKCIRTMQVSGFGLCTAFLGVDGSYAAVACKEGALEVFELGSGRCVRSIPTAHANAVWSMTLDKHIFEADMLITGSADKQIRFWNINDLLDEKKETVKPARNVTLPDEVLSVCVATGRDRPVLLAALMDSTVRALFMDTLEPAMNFYGHKLPVMAMDVSSDGQILATGSADKTVKLWGIDFGDCRRSLRAHSDSVVSIAFQPKTHYLFSGSRDGTLKYWDGDKFEFITELPGQRGEVWSIAVSADGEILASASHDKLMRVWRRTDNPLFLLEEQDRRMDEMLDSALIDDDVREARKERGTKIEFLDDNADGEALRAGKMTLDTVKGGERLLKALQLHEEETNRRMIGDRSETPNPELLGMEPDAYLLRILEQIRTADIEEVMHVLPLKEGMALLKLVSDLLAPGVGISRLSTETLVRAATLLVRIHQNQVIAGAIERSTVALLLERVKLAAAEMRGRFGVNNAALAFWEVQLAEENNAAFRDASAKAYNAGAKRKRRAGVAVK